MKIEDIEDIDIEDIEAWTPPILKIVKIRNRCDSKNLSLLMSNAPKVEGQTSKSRKVQKQNKFCRLLRCSPARPLPPTRHMLPPLPKCYSWTFPPVTAVAADPPACGVGPVVAKHPRRPGRRQGPARGPLSGPADTGHRQLVLALVTGYRRDPRTPDLSPGKAYRKIALATEV